MLLLSLQTQAWWYIPEHGVPGLGLCGLVLTKETRTVVTGEETAQKLLATAESTGLAQQSWITPQARLPPSLSPSKSDCPIPARKQASSVPGSCGCRLWL